MAPSVADGEVPNTLLVARPAAPYVSLGFHQSFLDELDPAFLARRPMPVLRRVTGGGTTYLDENQWFYQFVYREEKGDRGGSADLQKFLRAPVRAARDLGLFASFRPPSDLVVRERKISGNAGGDWEGARVIVGGFLGRADVRSMTDVLRLPDPALRSLLRREIGRWITSWRSERGHVPSPESMRNALVSALERERLFRVRVGDPTDREEIRFRTETLARHADPQWRELPPIPRRSEDPLRRIRVAGPHGLLVLRAADGEGLLAAIVDGDVIRERYTVSIGGNDRPRLLPPHSADAMELDGRLRGLLPLH